MLDLASKALDLLIGIFVGLRRVRVFVHAGFWLSTNEECAFINVTNSSRDREVELTHIWFATSPEVHIFNPERPLPKRLQADESWETWASLLALPALPIADLAGRVRVRLSTGRIFKGKFNSNVPVIGPVAGGPTSR